MVHRERKREKVSTGVVKEKNGRKAGRGGVDGGGGVMMCTRGFLLEYFVSRS